MSGSRVALISYHTCPLEQPGVGDSGGMNVYVKSLAEALARQGLCCDVFTRRIGPENSPVVVSQPGVKVFHIDAGPPQPATRAELPLYLPAFLSGVTKIASSCLAEYEVIHAHYWLSALAGRVLAERWDTPLVQTFHTLARAKNAGLAPGEAPEGFHRIAGETRAIASADHIVATTASEADLLVSGYGASPSRVSVVPPGVDPKLFSPAGRAESRTRTSTPPDDLLLLVAGRIQPLKGVDIAIGALGRLAADARFAGRIRLVVAGGPSGPGGATEAAALVGLVRELGIEDLVDFHSAVPQSELADWYRSADLVLVPSRSESFGLVALEAQACGTPVLASAVGGLPEVVADGQTGLIVSELDSEGFAAGAAQLLADPVRLRSMGRSAAERAASYSWRSTARQVIDLYASLDDRDTATSGLNETRVRTATRI